MTTSFDLVLPRGSLIVGKWKKGKYRIERMLGEGANGKVYLVHYERNMYAMKIGVDAIDLQSEINVLRTMEQQREQTGESFLIDVDDAADPNGKVYPFYIMRYIRGTTIAQYLMEKGPEWFPLLGLNLLGRLSKLHATGWVFGDLKLENVMVAPYGQVELVDFGGATLVGKGVRQFTEIYDRGYWNAGTRAADPAYDVFSFALLCVQLHEPKKLHQLTKSLIPQNRSTAELMTIVESSQSLKPMATWLRKALEGQFQDAGAATHTWRMMLRGNKKIVSSRTPKWLKGFIAASGVLLTVSILWLFINL